MRRADDEVELKKWHGFWLEEPVRRDCVALHSLIAGGAGRWFIDAFASYCTSGLVALCRSTPVTFA